MILERLVLLRVEHFEQGDFERAAQGFGDGYRRGVALYRAGKYSESAEAFARVERTSVKEDATYNLGNARYQLGDFAGAAATRARSWWMRVARNS